MVIMVRSSSPWNYPYKIATAIHKYGLQRYWTSHRRKSVNLQYKLDISI